MYLARKNIGIPLDRQNRNNHNDNYKELYGVVNNIVGTITDEVYEQIIDGAKLNWKSPVDSENDLPTSANEGDTVMTRDDGKVYRYDGAQWQEIQQIDAGPVNEVDSRLTSQLADITYDTTKLDSTGESDSSKSLQDILTSAKNGKVKKISIPKGTYRLDNPVFADSSDIEIDFNGSTILSYAENVDDNTVAGELGIINFTGKLEVGSIRNYIRDHLNPPSDSLVIYTFENDISFNNLGKI